MKESKLRKKRDLRWERWKNRMKERKWWKKRDERQNVKRE